MRRLERLEQAAHARADDGDELAILLAVARVVGERRDARERALLGRGVPRAIDDGVAQQAVEPRDGRLVVAQPGRGAAREAAHEGVLQDLLGELARAHAPLEEREKAPVIRHEDLERRGREPGARGAVGSRVVSAR